MHVPSTDSPLEREDLLTQVKGLDNRFWIVNVMEMFERLAYYGVRSVAAIYIVLPAELGGPEFSHIDKAYIFAWWAAVQSLLPMFTGGLADRYGHKNTIVVAILIKIVGYLLMATQLNFWGFFAGCMLLAAGTAIFKPGVQGTLAATLKDSNASVGWALFYQLVNVGGGIGPVLAGVLRLMDWQYVFISCAIIVSINFLWMPFYEDPSQDLSVDEEKQRAVFASLSRSVSQNLAFMWAVIWNVTALVVWAIFIGDALKTMDFSWLMMPLLTGVLAASFNYYLLNKKALDKGRADPVSVVAVSVVGLFQPRVFWFCIVFSGFWVMFNQVFDLLPNVIDDWVDTSGIIVVFGEGFSGPIMPSGLALFLALVAAFVCAVGILLSMRPDNRPATDVPEPAYSIVAIVFSAAWMFPALLAAPFALSAAGLETIPAIEGYEIPLTACGIAVVLGVVSALGAYVSRAPAQILAGAAAALSAIAGLIWLRSYFVDQAPTLLKLAEEGAQVPPEWMINLNAVLIVFTMVLFGYLTSFVRPLTSIIIGMVIATAGSILAGTAVFGWICLGGIAVFSVGEMLSSPKKMEYLASLSKRGQEGLFMGYANVPVAIGWIAGSIFAGNQYEEHGDKVNLAKRYLTDELGVSAETLEGLQKSEVVPFLADKLEITAIQVQHLLFDTYHPEQIWIQIGLIGGVSIVGMIVYDRVLRYVDGK